MRLLITGGAGFIGARLAKHLLESGAEVIVIDSLNDFYDPAIKQSNIDELSVFPTFEFYKGDIRSQDDLEQIFQQEKIDIVIHLAAMAGVRSSIKRPKLYYDVNINGTLNILEVMRTNGCKKLIFGSSSSVYGNNKTVPFSEVHPVDNPISPYAATKKSGELLCYNYHYLYNFDIFCLRFFSVYGPGQRPEMAIAKFTRSIFEGEEIPMYGDGNSFRDYTYVSDIIQGISHSLKKLKGFEIINLGNSNTISLRGLISLIEKHCEQKAVVKKLPMKAGDVMQTYADISKAKRILGYQPKTSIDAGIGQYVAWFKKYRLAGLVK